MTKYSDLELYAALSFLCPSMTISDFQVALDQNGIAKESLFSPGLWKFVTQEKKWKFLAEQFLKQLESAGFMWTHALKSDYPLLWKSCSYAPVAVTYVGQPVWNQRVCLSVVGSRDPLPLSIQWLETVFSKFFETQKQPPVLVSGGARGVDQWTHYYSLRKSHPTVAILPSGLENIYPSEFKPVVKQILDFGGAVISEYGPTQSMKKYHFVRRNRLISGLSQQTLIVQCAVASGTRITARWALEENRSVGVVPGHPLSQGFQGSLSLIQDGAEMICDWQDLDVWHSRCLARYSLN